MTKEESNHTIILKTEWVDMDKLVLTNHKGDTYTTKSEELMDFILSSESENESLNSENKEIIRKLIAAETRIVQLEKENEMLKAEISMLKQSKQDIECGCFIYVLNPHPEK